MTWPGRPSVLGGMMVVSDWASARPAPAGGLLREVFWIVQPCFVNPRQGRGQVIEKDVAKRAPIPIAQRQDDAAMTRQDKLSLSGVRQIQTANPIHMAAVRTNNVPKTKQIEDFERGAMKCRVKMIELLDIADAQHFGLLCKDGIHAICNPVTTFVQNHVGDVDFQCPAHDMRAPRRRDIDPGHDRGRLRMNVDQILSFQPCQRIADRGGTEPKSFP